MEIAGYRCSLRERAPILCAGLGLINSKMANNDDFSLLEDEQAPSEVRARPLNRHASQSISSSEAQKSREESLRQELASVKKVNEAIEGLLASLEKAKVNMKVRINSTLLIVL